jgi:hypothetical protein
MHWFGGLKKIMLTGSAIVLGAIAGERAVPLRRVWGFEPLEPRMPMSAAGLVPVGAQPNGGLSDKIVYVMGGHGYTANNPGNGEWSFQRSEVVISGTQTEMIEDLGNVDQMSFLADHLFRAGATVAPMRPVNHQTNEVVLDNDDAGVTFVGNWSNSTSGIYFGSAGDVPYKYASTSATETAHARYRPNIPVAGFYPVYAWTTYGGNRATDQLYRVNHSGGITEVTINHRRVGNGLVYLGTYYFDAGAAGYVDISNRSNSAGSVAIADMIRFGNGMGDINRGGGVSGLAREDEAALYWVEWHVARSQGIALSEYRTEGSTDRDATVGVSPRYSEYMNREADGALPDRALVSYHSNAAGGRGVLALHNTSHGGTTPNQVAYALALAQEINDDLVAQNGLLNPDWHNRGTNVLYEHPDFNYGELNNAYIDDEFDATIVEVAFHDELQDTQLMREQYVRDAVARATYQGLVKYFRSVDGDTTPATELPPPVTGVRAVSNAAGSVTVSWVPPVANSYAGGAATGYRIYASVNGYGFDGGTLVNGGDTTSATLTGYDPTFPYFFKVVAVNDGGESHGSEVVSALPSGGAKQVLIVNGFDRDDRSINPRQTLPAPDNTVDRVRLRGSNTQDYVVQVVTAIHAAVPGLHVASTSNEAVISSHVNLSDYDSVIWILGEESTADDTFNATEQTKVEQFIAAGGNLFVTGAEIAWDLDAQGNGVSFFENTLKGNYVSDDANTYTVAATAGGIFAGIANFSFDNGTLFYNSEWPDVINPQAGAQAALAYSGGTGGNAAIQVHGTGGRGNIVMFGFPFETITTAASRLAVIDRVFDFFNLAAIVPDNADFNGDVTANAADYIVWRKFDGRAVPAGTLGDANHNGQVNAADYAIWRNQFAAAPPAGGSATFESAASSSDAAVTLVAPWIARSANSIDVPRKSNSAAMSRRIVRGEPIDWATALVSLVPREMRKRFESEPDEVSVKHDGLSQLAARRGVRDAVCGGEPPPNSTADSIALALRRPISCRISRELTTIERLVLEFLSIGTR